jgi:protein TonB
MRIILIYIYFSVKSCCALLRIRTNIMKIRAMELTPNISGWKTNDRASRYMGLAIVVVLHAAVIVALLQYEPVRSAFTDAVPIMVSLISPQPAVEKLREPPKPLPVKPRVQLPTPPEPQQIIASTTEAPTPALAPAPPPPAPVTVAPLAQPQPAPVVAVPVVPPNFSADYLDNPPPVYPPLSRRVGEQGKVMLRVLVNAKGTVDKVELRTSSGSNQLDDAALDAVKRWRFVPARQGDQPVAAWVLIPITFSLKG